MNALGELLTADDIELDVDAIDKSALLHHVAASLAAKHGLPAAAIFAGLSARERLGSTGIGHGIAIPHARMPECFSAAGVFVRTRSPIAFDAPDHRQTSMFLGLVVPVRATDQHLHILAAAAAMLGDRNVREQVKTCMDPAAVFALFRGWSDPVS